MDKTYTDFNLSDMVEDASAQTHTEMMEAMKGDRPDLGTGGDDVGDVMDICRYGLAMSHSEVVGAWESERTVQVRAALVARAYGSANQPSSTSIQFEGETYEVCMVMSCKRARLRSLLPRVCCPSRCPIVSSFCMLCVPALRVSQWRHAGSCVMERYGPQDVSKLVRRLGFHGFMLYSCELVPKL